MLVLHWHISFILIDAWIGTWTKKIPGMLWTKVPPFQTWILVWWTTWLEYWSLPSYSSARVNSIKVISGSIIEMGWGTIMHEPHLIGYQWIVSYKSDKVCFKKSTSHMAESTRQNGQCKQLSTVPTQTLIENSYCCLDWNVLCEFMTLKIMEI
jgi:hypothetical protein